MEIDCTGWPRVLNCALVSGREPCGTDRQLKDNLSDHTEQDCSREHDAASSLDAQHREQRNDPGTTGSLEGALSLLGVL